MDIENAIEAYYNAKDFFAGYDLYAAMAEETGYTIDFCKAAYYYEIGATDEIPKG